MGADHNAESVEMIKLKSDANVKNLESILKQMAQVSEQILSSGIEGKENEVRTQLDRMRQLKSDIETVEEKYKTFFDTRPTAEKKKIAELIAQINKSEEFRTAWASRYKDLVPTKVLIELEEGPDAILDWSLPLAWDWKHDLIVFSKHSDERLIHSLVKRGQKRILVFCADGLEPKYKTDDVIYLLDEKSIEGYLGKLGPNLPRRVCTFDKIVKPANEIEDSELKVTESFFEKFEKTFFRSIVNKQTITYFANRWINQGLQNLTTIAVQPSFKNITEHINNIPAVIISPGPSLDKNIKQLRQLKNKALLIAPAQTLLALDKEGIVPDIVIVADPQNLMYLFENYDASKLGALLIGVACQPELFKKYKEKVISFNVNGPLDGWVSDIFGDVNYRGACGSVSSMAFLLSSVLNCDPIILVGQDLSFSNGKQYSKGSADGGLDVSIDEENKTFACKNIPKGLREMDINNITEEPIDDAPQGRILTLPGYYGGEVYTKPDYAMFHAEFERLAQINLEAKSDLKLYNCTEGGAFIEGFEHVTLQEAINTINEDGYPDVNFDQISQKIFNSIDKVDRLKKLGIALTEIESGIDKSIRIAKKCLKLASTAKNTRDNLDELSKNEKELFVSVQASNFISMAMHNEIRKIMKLTDSASTLESNIDASKLLYQLIITEFDKILPNVSQSIKDYDKVIAERVILDIA